MARLSRSVSRGGGPLRLLERTGISRGIFGGRKGWIYVGTGLWTLRKVRELGQGKPEVLLMEELKPGQRLVIANDRPTLDSAAPGRADPTSRRGRKAASKADRKATAKAERQAASRRGRKAARRAGQPS